MSNYLTTQYLVGKEPKEGSQITYSQPYISYQDNHGGGTKTVKAYQMTHSNRDWIRNNLPVSATCGYGSDFSIGYFDPRQQLKPGIIFPFTFYTNDAMYRYEEDQGFRPPYHYTMISPGRIYLHSIHAVYETPQFETFRGCIDIQNVLFSNYLEEVDIEPPVPDEGTPPDEEPVEDEPASNTFLDFSNDPRRYSSIDYDPHGVFQNPGEDDQIWFDRMDRLFINNSLSGPLLVLVKPEIYDGEKISLKLYYPVSKEISQSTALDLLNSTRAYNYNFDEVAIPMGINIHTNHYYTPPVDNNINQTLVPKFILSGELHNFIGNPNSNVFILVSNGDEYLLTVLSERRFKSIQISSEDYYNDTSGANYGVTTVYVSNDKINELMNSQIIVNDNMKFTSEILQYLGVEIYDTYNDNDTTGEDYDNNTTTTEPVDENGNPVNNETNVDETGNEINKEPIQSTVDTSPFLPDDYKTVDTYTSNEELTEIKEEIKEELKDCACKKLDKIIEMKENKQMCMTDILLIAIAGVGLLLAL